MPNEEILRLLMRALEEPYGIVVESNSAEQFKRKARQVCREHKKQGLTQLESIRFRTSPDAPETEVWITHDLASEEPTDEQQS